MSATRIQVVEAARRHLGVPWRHQGRSELGIDCVGLLVVVARELGLSEYDLQGYDRRPNPGSFLQHFEAWGALRIRIADALPGDTLVFNDGLYPCHAGWATLSCDQPGVIHAYAPRRRVVEERLAPDLKRRQIAAFRLPGIV